MSQRSATTVVVREKGYTIPTHVGVPSTTSNETELKASVAKKPMPTPSIPDEYEVEKLEFIQSGEGGSTTDCAGTCAECGYGDRGEATCRKCFVADANYQRSRP